MVRVSIALMPIFLFGCQVSEKNGPLTPSQVVAGLSADQTHDRSTADLGGVDFGGDERSISPMHAGAVVHDPGDSAAPIAGIGLETANNLSAAGFEDTGGIATKPGGALADSFNPDHLGDSDEFIAQAQEGGAQQEGGGGSDRPPIGAAHSNSGGRNFADGETMSAGQRPESFNSGGENLGGLQREQNIAGAESVGGQNSIREHIYGGLNREAGFFAAVCGDGILTAGEICDDGNTTTERCPYGETGCLVCTAQCQLALGQTQQCGDGRLQHDEQCDDGNTVTEVCVYGQPSCMVCDENCTLQPGEVGLCGDGLIQNPENCDDGNRVTERCAYGVGACLVCDANCTLQLGATRLCGNGLIDEGEGCDDGNVITEECLYGEQECVVCASDCRLRSGVVQVCGDGIQNLPEACDDGNRVTEHCAYGESNCLVCAADCTIAFGVTHICGDGNTDASEECDDGNLITETCSYGPLSCSVCASDCTLQAGETHYCGDGSQDPGEACDDGNVVTEMCDYGATGCTICDEYCDVIAGATRVCGDGKTDVSEECDDGNLTTEECPYGVVACTVCNAQCESVDGAIRVCGDNNLDPEESCDDGNTVIDDCPYGVASCVVCGTQCTSTAGIARVCGDGVWDPEEDCDDNDTRAGDCPYGVERCEVCSASCRHVPGKAHFCGDGVVDEFAGEDCDGVLLCTTACELIPRPVARIETIDDLGHEGGAEGARFRIFVSAPLPFDFSIEVALGGTAVEGEDYFVTVDDAAFNGLVTLPAGQVSAELVVTPIATPEVERTEFITVSIAESDLVSVDLNRNEAVARIVENGPSPGAIFYVGPEGDDANLGTEEAPFATLGHALEAMAPGDTVYLFDGRYTNTNFTNDHGADGRLRINNGPLARVGHQGAPDRWTTIAAYPDGNDTRPLLEFDGAGGLQLLPNASYIVIDGLEIAGPNRDIRHEWAHVHRWSKESFYSGRGIYTWGPVHHVVVRNCHVHHTPNSGIRFNSSDYILVEDNTVSNTTWWSSSAESGIVIATAQHIDEEDTVKILYSSNTVYNNWNFMEFCSGPGGPVGAHQGSIEDVYGNCDRYTGGIIDGQGLYVTRNNQTYLHGRMRFEYNIAYNNGFGGVVFHKTDRGELVGNIVFMNGAYPGTSNYTGLTVNTADDLLIAQNIVWARDQDDYGIKNNGNASNVSATANYIVGKTQFGTPNDNTITAFVDAPPFQTVFHRAVDLSSFIPDPHLTDGALSPPEIDKSIVDLELDFGPARDDGL